MASIYVVWIETDYELLLRSSDDIPVPRTLSYLSIIIIQLILKIIPSDFFDTFPERFV